MSNIFDLIIVVSVLVFLSVVLFFWRRFKNPYEEEIENSWDVKDGERVVEKILLIKRKYKNGQTKLIKKVIT